MARRQGARDFRKVMLADKRIRVIVDYPNAGELFPGVDIKGGVCYLLWNRDMNRVSAASRWCVGRQARTSGAEPGQFDIFVRDSRALEILHKVKVEGSNAGFARIQ